MAITLAEIAQRSNSQVVQGILKTIIERSPLLSLIPFRTAPSKRVDVTRESSLPPGSFRGGSEAFTGTKAVTNKTQVHLKLFGSAVDIDFTDMEVPTFDGNTELAYQVGAHTRGMALDMKKNVIEADPGVDSKEFTGIKGWHSLFNSEGIDNQVLLNGAANGATISSTGGEQMLRDFNSAINRLQTLDGSIGMTNRDVISDLEALTLTSASNNVFAQYFKPELININGVTVQGGRFKGIPIIAVDEDSQGNKLLGFNETIGNSNITSSIYFATFSEDYVLGYNQFQEGIKMREIQSNTGVRVSMDWPSTLVAKHPKSITRLAGILA